ncbi:MAG: DoxX family membrane protein [Phycisphaerales bacterium]|nr:DoxX family membrane protein [Phycisphaerales bacterium]
MGFSRVAALHLTPLLTRIVLCAVFVPAGWSKIMDEVEFSGPTAASIRSLTGAQEATSTPVAFRQELTPPSETARLSAESPLKVRRLYGLAVMLHEAELPYPVILAWLAAITELVGGGLLLFGLFSRIWSVGLGIAMGVAFVLTSFPAIQAAGPFGLDPTAFTKASAQIALFVLALGIVLGGPGGISLDQAIFGGRTHLTRSSPRASDSDHDDDY